MMDNASRNNLRWVVISQVALCIALAVMCIWRATDLWANLHLPPPHTVAIRYQALRLDQFNTYICICVVLGILMIDRLINFWLLTRKMQIQQRIYGRRATDIARKLTGDTEELIDD